MAMLDYSEVVEKKYIVFEGAPYEVISSHVFRKQQRKPVNATRIKNLLTGKLTEHSFHVSEKIEEAEIDTRQVKFLYKNRGEFWFCEEKDSSKRFSVTEDVAGPRSKFIKANTVIDLMTFDEKIIGFKFPISVELKVTEAVDAVKGNTISGGNKRVTLETGAEINVPMFVNQGDIIKINTETEEYSERVSK